MVWACRRMPTCRADASRVPDASHGRESRPHHALWTATARIARECNGLARFSRCVVKVPQGSQSQSQRTVNIFLMARQHNANIRQYAFSLRNINLWGVLV